jgi:hypothetical protein
MSCGLEIRRWHEPYVYVQQSHIRLNRWIDRLVWLLLPPYFMRKRFKQKITRFHVQCYKNETGE